MRRKGPICSSTNLLLLLTGLLLCFCTSCDTGFPFSALPSLRSNNFVWAESPDSPFDEAVDAYYYQRGPAYWVVLQKTGTVVPLGGHYARVVLICFNETTACGKVVYQLQAGLLINAFGIVDGYPAGSAETRVLKSEAFVTRRHRRSIKLAYNGEVYSPGHIGGGAVSKDRLRFEVRPKKSRDKVLSMIKKLHPSLEQEPDASAVLACLDPLISQVNGGT